MKIEIGKRYYYKKHGKEKEYVIEEVVKYKDERSNGWIEAVIYKPLYPCDVDKFVRSKSMFISEFEAI